MGKGQRHSKNAGVMGSEGFTYHEKRALGFGTVRERIGRDSQANFDDCRLTLQPAVDPVCTPEGCVFSREAILENILQQKKSIKRKVAIWQTQQERQQRLEEENVRIEREAELLAFDRQNNLAISEDKIETLAQSYKESMSKEVVEGEDYSKGMRVKGIRSVVSISDNADRIKELKSFWHPSKAPESKILTEKPTNSILCPSCGKKLKMRELIKMHFISVPRSKSNGERYMDPITRKALTNSSSLVVLKENGIVMLEESYKKCVKPEGKYEGRRIDDRNVIKLKCGGTGYAAKDGDKAEAKRYFPLGPGSGMTDLRGQTHGPKSLGGLQFWN